MQGKKIIQLHESSVLHYYSNLIIVFRVSLEILSHDTYALVNNGCVLLPYTPNLMFSRKVHAILDTVVPKECGCHFEWEVSLVFESQASCTNA